MSTNAVKDAKELPNNVGKQVTIGSVAEDASMGAIVSVGRMPVYIDGLERWDKAHRGQKVIVTGTLTREAPEQLTNAAGEHSHGVPGGRYILEAASWSLA